MEGDYSLRAHIIKNNNIIIFLKLIKYPFLVKNAMDLYKKDIYNKY